MKQCKKISRCWEQAAISLGMLLLLTGCPKTELPPIQSPFPEISGLSTETVSKMIDRRAAAFHSLHGIGKVYIKNWEEQYKFSEAFVLEAPSKFRLETLGFLDQPVIFFTSDGGMLSLFSKKHNTFYRGVTSQENLFKLSGINLQVEDMLLVFSGNPPHLQHVNSEWGVALPERNQFYLERISLQRNTLQRIVFDTQTRTISGIEEYMLTNGELTLNVVFENYRAEAGGYAVPASIQIERPFDNVRVDITYNSLEVNRVVDDRGLFSFDAPVNAETHFLDAASDAELERLSPFDAFRVKEEE